MGPVLELQDRAEAKTNVDKRLDFIRNSACQPRLTTYMSVSVDSSLEWAHDTGSRVETNKGSQRQVGQVDLAERGRAEVRALKATVEKTASELKENILYERMWGGKDCGECFGFS